ncbi:MAG: single-stranded-DNA-specific exonuclease RecJ [Patescibacteria group bacterium]
MIKNWILPFEKKEAPVGNEFANLHPVALRLLAFRGIEDAEAVRKFFKPNWETDIHDPFLFSQMGAAVERVFMALIKGEHITVHGDYDADGVSGSAIVIQTLREIQKKINESQNLIQNTSDEIRDTPDKIQDSVIDYYIPHRDKEGYGLHVETVEELTRRGTNLLITVDCGIASTPEISLARTLGMDVLVLDHHQYNETLPDAILVHPKLPNETYDFPHLAAVGVAWKFASALIEYAREKGVQIKIGWEKWLLDLVSIATVTDMVPLIGENRTLEFFGLKVLNKTPRPGLVKLMAIAGLRPGSITSESVAFAIGPRLNAAGRMDHASLALELLLAEDDSQAELFAKQLEELNKMRQKTTAKMMDEAKEKLNPDDNSSVLILWSEDWSPALVGLVAGRFLDITGKPTVAIGKFGDRWVGSGRSISVYNITEAVTVAGDGLLTHVGGHVQACGFSFVNDESLLKLVSNLKEHAALSLLSQDLSPTIQIDAEIGLADLNWNLIESLDLFEPYGEGNKRPFFMTRDLEVMVCEKVGSSMNHLRCLLESKDGMRQKFMGFNLASKFEWLNVGDRVDVVYHVGVNEWNGRRDIQCKIVDMKLSS